jgi:CDP-diacylglycerol---glycerol-3-phosphate 3-phosphatidyltransferase
MRRAVQYAACGHRGCLRPSQLRMLTAATVVTMVRTVASVSVGLYGAVTSSLTFLLVGLGIYWVGDMADGALARLTDTETRAGATFDIVCDRFCAATFYLGFAWLDPSMILPVGVFLFEFMVIDMFLSLAFLSWPLVSPDYFALVDKTIWRWNWSKLGKALNSSAVALLMVFTRSALLCTVVALCVLGLKLWSLRRLSRLGIPAPVGCAAAGAPAGVGS